MERFQVLSWFPIPTPSESSAIKNGRNGRVREGLCIQTRNLRGLLTSQFIFSHLTPYLKRKQQAQQKKSPFDQKYARTPPTQAAAVKVRRNRLLVSSFRTRQSSGGIIYLSACQFVLLIKFPIFLLMTAMLDTASMYNNFFSRSQLLAVEAASSRREGSTWHHLPPPTHRCPPSFPGSRPAWIAPCR